MNKNHLFHVALVIALAILITGCFNNSQTSHKVIASAVTSFPTDYFSDGWGINTPSEAAKAASDGIQVAFIYSFPASPP